MPKSKIHLKSKVSKTKKSFGGFGILGLGLNWKLGFGNRNFRYFSWEKNSGIVLLLVLLILSSLLSISIGIFNLTIGEIRTSGEIADSFIAFYAADGGIEKTLYLDRVAGGTVCVNPQGNPVNGQDCYIDNQILSNQSGFNIKVSKTPNSVEIKAIGQYQCPGVVGSGMCGIDTFRVVKRGFSVTY